MASKRSRLEMYLDVLNAIKKGIDKPTRIMYRTNLSWKPLMEVLDAMMTQELVEANRKGRHTLYKVTEKGKNLLNYFHKAMELLETK